MTRTKVIVCLYGGPGTGKSTAAAGVFYELKRKGFNAELNREYVKDWVWEGRPILEGDQSYFFAKQSRKERYLMLQGLDFIVTDSPLILTHFYGMKYDPAEQRCNTSEVLLAHHHKFCQHYGYKIEHFFLERAKDYNPAGRYQTEDEARQFDLEIKSLLNSKGIKYTTVVGEDHTPTIVEHLMR